MLGTAGLRIWIIVLAFTIFGYAFGVFKALPGFEDRKVCKIDKKELLYIKSELAAIKDDLNRYENWRKFKQHANQ